MYDQNSLAVSAGADMYVSDELLLDLWPFGVDLEVDDNQNSPIVHDPIKAESRHSSDIEEDESWTALRRLQVASDGVYEDSENLVQYPEEDRKEHQKEIEEFTAKMRKRLLGSYGLQLVASDRACAEAEAILRDVYALPINVENPVPEFASIISDVEEVYCLLKSSSLPADVQTTIVSDLASSMLRDLEAKRKQSRSATAFRQLLRKNEGLMETGSVVMAQRKGP